MIIDIRSRGLVPHYPRWHKKAGELRASRARRPVDKIRAQAWHHTGTSVRGRDSDQEAIKRALTLPYHVVVFRRCVVAAYDFSIRTYHGGKHLNHAIGVAVAGRFNVDASKDTDRIADFEESIATALDWLAAEVPGASLLLTHSQTARKPHDPGESIARILAGRCDYSTDPDYTAGSGRPWPAAWRVPR